MKSWMTILIVFLAGIMVAWLGFRVDRDSGPRAGPDADRMRVAVFDQNVEVKGAVDPAQILYREVATLTPPGLQSLAAIAVDSGDRIYAGGGRKLTVFDAGGTEIRRMEMPAEIRCLALDEDDRLYVGFDHAVHAYDAAGRQMAVFEDIDPDAIITSLAARGNHVFVADAQQRAVMRFTPDGVLQGTIDGRRENGEGTGFVVPSPYFSVTLGQGQTLWIVNPGRHRLEEYNFNGDRIHAWQRNAGLAVDGFSGCCNPSYIARLSDGNLVTSERGLPRVKVYTRRGDFVGVVAAPDRFDRHTAGLDVAVDSNDRILVADSDRVQVRVFERTGQND